MNITVSKQSRIRNSPILLETLLITTISLGGILLLPQFKLIFSLLPIAYLLSERRIRQRTWADLGFKFDTLWDDLRNNWFWFSSLRG